ncbi:MAG TPA: hypothetical protein VMH61_07725 [Candidatus Acidoferrales bacterium]|nr:hypothetical protein [Candidatus Acidoferrales bacterium]
MNAGCKEFDRWLDAGAPAAGERAVHDHAAGCARCAARLEAARTLDALLAAPPVAPAREGFADAVMRRIARPPQARTRAASTPWWLGLAAEPAAALAVALAVVTATLSAPLWSAALALARRMPAFAAAPTALHGAGPLAALWNAQTWAGAGQLAALWRAQPWAGGGALAVSSALVAFAPAVLAGSWLLFRWLERSVGHARPGRV